MRTYQSNMGFSAYIKTAFLSWAALLSPLATKAFGLISRELNQDANFNVSPDAVSPISTCEELQAITNLGNYVLASDINCTATRNWNNGSGFIPIANFSGTLDGNGYTIFDLYENPSNGYTLGLFSVITQNGKISNLNLAQASMKTSAPGSAGLLAAGLWLGASVQNVTVQGTVIIGGATGQAGLLIGSMSINTTVINCRATGFVNASIGTAGGLVGSANHNTVIKQSSASVQAEGLVAGGLVGILNSGLVQNSHAHGLVIGIANYAVGGLLGQASGPSQVVNSYATNQIIVSPIPNPNGYTGGLIGRWINYRTGLVNSYYDTQTSGQSDTGKGIPLTTTQMTAQASYQNWDFVTTWEIEPGASYPSLRVEPLSITFGNIATPQQVNTPFPITLTAQNGNYTGGVYFFSDRGPINPSYVSMFGGTWAGDVTVSFVGKATSLKLQWVDIQSRKTFNSGSNAFDVTDNNGIIPSDALLNGRVKDSNRAVVSNAVVKLYLQDPATGGAPVYQTTTDQNGRYQFSGITPTLYYVQIQKSGYQISTQPVQTESQMLVTSNFVLNAACSSNKIPVLFVPGIMGSKERGLVYPRLSTEPLEWNDSRLKLHGSSAVGWSTLRKLLKQQGYITGCTIIDVPYNWRLSVPLIRDLYLRPWIAEAKRRTGQSKVDIVAHSMGGLVTRTHLQSFDYPGDVRKFAMVGTPNQGSALPYYLWEGGDPIAADVATGDPFGTIFGIAEYFYTNTLFYNARDAFGIKLCDFGFIEKFTPSSCDAQAVYSFLHDNVPAAHNIMASYDNPLADYAGDTRSIILEENTFLRALNLLPCHNPGGCVDNTGEFYTFQSPAHVMSADNSKVQTYLFIGTDAKETVSTIYVTPQQQGYQGNLYQDGVPPTPIIHAQVNVGDSIVLNTSVLFNFAFPSGAALPSYTLPGVHGELIGVFADEVATFITGTSSKFTPFDDDTAFELGVMIDGRIQPFLLFANATIQDERSLRYSQLTVNNPSSGNYSVFFNSTVNEDFELSLMYIGTNQSFFGTRVTGFYDSTFTSCNFSLNTSVNLNETMWFDRSFGTPINLQMQNDSEDNVELLWQDPSGQSNGDVEQYQIFYQSDADPYLHFLATSQSQSYQTNQTWSEIIGNSYVVRSLLNIGRSTFFSEPVVARDNAAGRTPGLFSRANLQKIKSQNLVFST